MPKRSGFVRRIGVRLVMLLTLGVVFLVALRSSPLLRLLHFTLSILSIGGDFLAQAVITAVPAALVMLAFMLAYRFIQERKPGWRASIIGGVVAMHLFVAAKPLFLGYVQALARHNVIYGSIGGIVAVVIWAWVVAMIGFFGGQIACHCQAILFEGEPIEKWERRARDVP